MAELVTQRQWQAPDKLKIRQDPAKAYRYVTKETVEHRIDEGWVVEMLDGKPRHYRGLILMSMPKSMADERNKYYRDIHARRIRAVARGGAMQSVHKAATSSSNNSAELAGTIGRGLDLQEGTVTTDGLVHTNNTRIPVDAHPDDLAEDRQVASELRESLKDVPEGAGEDKDKPSAQSTKRKYVKRR